MSNSVGTISCTNCDRAFRWKPELAGRTVRCKCGVKLAIAKEPPVQQKPKARRDPEPEFNPFADMFDDLKAAESAVAVAPVGMQTLPQQKTSWRTLAKPSAPGRRSPKANAVTQLKVAGAGLLIHFGGFALMALTLCWMVLHIMNNGMPEKGGPAGDFQRIVGLASLASMGMIFFGPLLCLVAPSQAGRGKLIGGLVSYIVAMVLPFVAAGSMGQSQSPVGLIITFLVSGVLMLIGTGFVLSFLCSLADYLGEASLQASAESLLGLYKFMLAGYIAAVVLAIIPVVGVIVNLVIGLVALLLIARYILLTGRLAFAILRR